VGGSGAGRGLWPPAGKGQRGAVAGAMAPAMEAVKVPSPLRAGTGNAPRFPARARRCPVDRQVREQRRPAPDPAGAKRPPWAGRALAGGFGPRLARGSAALWQGRWPLPLKGEGAFAPPGGIRNRDPRFPVRARRCPADRQVQEQQKAGDVGYQQICGTQIAAPGRWPLRGRRGAAEQSPVFQSAVHAVGTFSAACSCPPPSGTLPDCPSGTRRHHGPGICETLSAPLRHAEGDVPYRQGRNDPAPPATGKSA
jgi:hypothetical protein